MYRGGGMGMDGYIRIICLAGTLTLFQTGEQIMPTSCILMTPCTVQVLKATSRPDYQCNVTTKFFDIPPPLLLIALKLLKIHSLMNKI